MAEFSPSADDNSDFHAYAFVFVLVLALFFVLSALFEYAYPIIISYDPKTRPKALVFCVYMRSFQ
jgi:hypothetical protein